QAETFASSPTPQDVGYSLQRERERQMPLFDFRCGACGHVFEALVRPQDPRPECPRCHAADLERQLPTFAVSSAEKTQAAADKKRKKEAAAARRDNIAMDIEAERHRLEDH